MKFDKAENYRKDVIDLLKSENLPSADLPATLANFIVALQNDQVIAVAGLEVFNAYGLLRSVVVAREFRRQGFAGKLLQQIDDLSRQIGLKELYLLTETAAAYFESKGYQRIVRADVPAVVRQSSQFSHVCPQSAVVMKKLISFKPVI